MKRPKVTRVRTRDYTLASFNFQKVFLKLQKCPLCYSTSCRACKELSRDKKKNSTIPTIEVEIWTKANSMTNEKAKSQVGGLLCGNGALSEPSDMPIIPQIMGQKNF